MTVVGGNAGESKPQAEETEPEVHDATSSTCTKRPACTRCRRPSRVCLCPFLPPTRLALPPHLSILVLQHAAEGKSNPVKCTVSILEAVVEGGREGGQVGTDTGEEGLERVMDGKLLVIVRSRRRVDGETDARLARALEEEGTVLLYLTEGARDVRELVDQKREWEEDREEGEGDGGEVRGDRRRKITLIVLDGTWESARRMYARNKCLHALPTVCLPLPSPLSVSIPAPAPARSSSSTSKTDEEDRELQAWLARPPIFTVRKEPPEVLGKGGRSTAEAVALVLFLLGEKRVAEVIIEAVRRANGMQLSLTYPGKVRHRRERKGYIENLYTVGGHLPSVPPSLPLPPALKDGE